MNEAILALFVGGLAILQAMPAFLKNLNPDVAASVLVYLMEMYRVDRERGYETAVDLGRKCAGVSAFDTGITDAEVKRVLDNPRLLRKYYDGPFADRKAAVYGTEEKGGRCNSVAGFASSSIKWDQFKELFLQRIAQHMQSTGAAAHSLKVLIITSVFSSNAPILESVVPAIKRRADQAYVTLFVMGASLFVEDPGEIDFGQGDDNAKQKAANALRNVPMFINLPVDEIMLIESVYAASTDEKGSSAGEILSSYLCGSYRIGADGLVSNQNKHLPGSMAVTVCGREVLEGLTDEACDVEASHIVPKLLPRV